MTVPSAGPRPTQAIRSGLPLPPGPLIGFGLAVIALLIITLLRQVALQRSEQSVAAVTHTLEVITQVEGLLSLVKDAETGQRGYLLTGDESYLDPYIAANAALQSQLSRVRTLTNDNPEQQERLAKLQRMAEEKLGELARTIALRREGKTTEGLQLVRSDRGKGLMDGIRALALEMENSERALLGTRR
jgi:CHASE3 domain sensor protein